MNDPYPFPVKHVSVHEGIDIAYVDEGQGEPLIFIHGLANYIPAWKHQVAGLKDQYRCIAIDLPGNGLSSRGDYPYSMTFYAECVKRFADAVGLQQYTLVGHSMGGQIAMILALRYPALVKKLVLTAPAGLEQFSTYDVILMQNMLSIGEYFYSDEQHLETAINDSFFKPHAEAKQIISELTAILRSHPLQQWRSMSMASINGMLNEQITRFLPHIIQPTLILFGDKDRMIPNRFLHPVLQPVDVARQGAAAIPGAEWAMIADAGHFLQVEKPGPVNEAIRDFMAKG